MADSRSALGAQSSAPACRVGRVAIAVVLAGAFWLRVYLLDHQSFWSDEGATAYMTGRGLGEILAASAADIHPPLYYLLVAVWAKLAGTSEFALRFPSVVTGVLVVGLTYWLGRRCLGLLPGLLGSIFAAGSGLLIYYSQEARMYELMACLGLAMVALAVALAGIGQARRAGLTAGSPLGYLASLFRGQKKGAAAEGNLACSSHNRGGRAAILAAGYVVAMTALLYTQYLGILAAGAANLIVFGHLGLPGRSGRVWIVWLTLQAAAGLLFLPWGLRVLGQVGGWPAISEPLQPGPYLRDVFRVFSFGLSWDATVTAPAEIFVGALLVLGLLWPLVAPGGVRRGGAGLAVVLVLVVIPVAGLFLLSQRRPLYNPKFLLPAVPAFALWLGLGVATAAALAWRIVCPLSRLVISGAPVRKSRRPSGGSLGRCPSSAWAGAAATAAGALTALGLLALFGYFDARGLRAYYTEAKYQRDDYRGMAAMIEVAHQPGDAISLNAPGQAEILGY